MQKYRKNYLEMVAPTLLKAVFKFLNMFAEEKSRLLNVILLWLSTSNSGLVFFFAIVFYWHGSFFTQGRLFSLNGLQSLFSVKLCSAQKFMIGYDISIIQHPYIKYT